MVSWEGDEVAGAAACVVRPGLIAGKLRRLGYVFQVFTVDKYRRRGVAMSLVESLEHHLKIEEVDVIFLAIESENVSSVSLFESAGFALYRVVRRVGFFPPVPGIGRAGIVRRATDADLTAISQLINATWVGYDLFEPVSPGSINSAVARRPGLEIDHFLLLEVGGKLRACVAYWDASELNMVLVRSVSPEVRRQAENAPAGTKAKIPVAGQIMKPSLEIAYIGYRDSLDMNPLFARVAEQADEQISFFACELDSDLPNTVAGTFVVDGQIRIHAKSLSPHGNLSGGPMYSDVLEMF
jgi:N-acetylglutamate synthase-like GNAT family acetyltransferase